VDEHTAATCSGPLVARTFHRVLAAIFAIAWGSLLWQLDLLIGQRGLLPAAGYVAAAERQGIAFMQLPTLFWFDASDAALHAAAWCGLALAVAALCGVVPRLCLGLSTLLYLSYASVARSFLSFQWDNLLLECGALAIFLPRHRPSRWIHVLFRVLLVKLYVESGIAKWESGLGDWQDGSAMRFYYETAPLPVWPAWYAHHLPAWFHAVESRAVLGLELVLPWLAFGPHRARLLLFAALSGFQLINLATANYGFFVYLALALHLFLLADGDLARLGLRPRLPESTVPPSAPALRRIGAAAVVAVYLGLSLVGALLAFVELPAGLGRGLAAIHSLDAPWRLANTYHLFGSITRERIEPQFEVEQNGTWLPLDLWHKPGDVQRAPDLVAPHQPRVDFQLWFYGLSFQRGMPEYVGTLLDRLCDDPAAVQPLFVQALPENAEAVRLTFWRYTFSAPDDSDRGGAWWTRQPVAEFRPLPCRTVAAGDAAG
jgi:hypothetical protein